MIRQQLPRPQIQQAPEPRPGVAEDAQALYGNQFLQGQSQAALGLLTPLLGLLGCADSELDQALDAAAARSTALSGALGAARRAGWSFALGSAGGGSHSDRHARVVTLDPDRLRDPDALARTLAHELGHVRVGAPTPALRPGMSRDQYIRENTWSDLRGEAEATVMELEVRDDILAGGGPDIGITGSTAADKKRLWRDHQARRLTRAQLVEALAKLFAYREITSDTHRSYWDHYAARHAAAWDANHPTPTPLPLPPP